MIRHKQKFLLLLVAILIGFAPNAQTQQRRRVLVLTNAKGTYDPDGDSMSYLWMQYPKAGTYKGLVSFAPYASNLYDLPVTAPVVT